MTREERTDEQMILRQRRGDSSPRLVGCGCDGVGAAAEREGGVEGERAERESVAPPTTDGRTDADGKQ